MCDADWPISFESHLYDSQLLAALRGTLKYMLEGSYISKSTADNIMREAAELYHRLLRLNYVKLPSHYMMGRLQQYHHNKHAWYFTVYNPIVCLGYDQASLSAPVNTVVVDENYSHQDPARITSDQPLSDARAAFCYPGYVKIKAVIPYVEPDSS
ncbi:hypothetical protein BBBOND_0312250 [Babesia bigemina]|uniref:Uncharacterized protein n=1 Tax=Babesia bigemina TaxID=5866 RepID=A0A061DBL3_BABBI|nr:hypothetical protein BBBOND_0312250 [Babesia bigemina]CDR97322.1 hypothetical protein BBBOND_0312250 [Babesia bigemina]|eukprot:XP_012769508.1 hypothetical protein BBBOND_0312250 [Babesia bigemina]